MVQHIILAVLRFSIIVALALTLYFRSWSAIYLIVLSFFLTLVPVLVERYTSYFLPIEVHLVFVLFIFITLFLGTAEQFYHKFWWWDGLLHTFFGFGASFLAFLVLNMLYVVGKIKVRPIFIAFWVFAFTLMLATLWEIFEFAIDVLFGTHMQAEMTTGVTDTMVDLVVASFGALVVCTLGYISLRLRGRKRGKKPLGYVDDVSDTFIEKNRDRI